MSDDPDFDHFVYGARLLRIYALSIEKAYALFESPRFWHYHRRAMKALETMPASARESVAETNSRCALYVVVEVSAGVALITAGHPGLKVAINNHDNPVGLGT